MMNCDVTHKIKTNCKPSLIPLKVDMDKYKKDLANFSILYDILKVFN